MDLYTEVLKEYQLEEMEKLDDILTKISLRSDDYAVAKYDKTMEKALDLP